jgi:DNA mismatch endonuclease (patch repair protein)
MVDVFTPKKRSEVMAHIKSRNNRDTELLFASILRANSIWGWRRHAPIKGRPDFVFREVRLAVFVDGCFWHCCPKCGNMPANNRKFWRLKLGKNKVRDRFVTRTLRAEGWKVLRIWEHELSAPDRVVRRLTALLGQGSSRI